MQHKAQEPLHHLDLTLVQRGFERQGSEFLPVQRFEWSLPMIVSAVMFGEPLSRVIIHLAGRHWH